MGYEKISFQNMEKKLGDPTAWLSELYKERGAIVASIQELTTLYSASVK